MSTININLLPIDNAIKQKKQRKFRTVQLISTGILLLLIFLASGAVALRILQSQDIKKIQTQVEASENDISSQKDKESGVFILKSRLTVISQYLGKVSKQVANYNYISGKTPDAITVSSVSVDRSGGVNLSIQSADTAAINDFIEGLINSDAAGIFSTVEIESLSRGRDAGYRASIKLVSK